MLYSGIDLHKRTIAIHTVDAAGTLAEGRSAHQSRGNHRVLHDAYWAPSSGVRVHRHVVLGARSARATGH